MNTFLKSPVFKTIVYYLIVGSLVAYFNLSGEYRTGPCNPGLDIVSIFFAFIASIVLIPVNIARYSKGGKKFLPSILIHLFVVLAIIAMGVFGK